MAPPTAQEPEAEQVAGEDVKKPKKAASAYWLFTGKVREEVTKEVRDKNGGKANVGEIAKTMSARWAALSDEAKKEFEDQAAEDKKRYEEELKSYREASDPAGTLRKKYEHLIPKKPMSAYFLFSQDPAQREKAAAALKDAGIEADNKKLASKLGEMWKAASTEEKGPFEDKHKAEQAAFLQKQKEWQATPEFAEIERAANLQAEKQQASDGQGEKEAKGVKRGRPAAGGGKGKESKAESTKEASPKKSRKAAAAKDQAPEPAVDADVLAEAAKLGLEGPLKNLAGRPEVTASGKTSREIFKALQGCNGLVNPAKRALLGA